ncbi:MAG: rRNA adenine N-6-methyltransferase family protein, partial [bacterium]
KRHLSFPFKIVSNIPFSITAQILQRIVDFKNNLSLVVITVQKEVADKLLPPPNRYASPLSLYITFHFKIERKFVINRRAFLPPPEVDARVIKMSPQPPPIPLEDEEEFFQ